MTSIEQLYAEQMRYQSDIRDHLPRLRALAAECDHVTEFGVRAGVSTTALLAAQPAVLECYDIERNLRVSVLERAAGKTRFTFHLQDTLTADIEPTDLLFIDTVHTGAQVYAELTRHAERVRRWLAFHDTVSCGLVDPYYPEQPGLLAGINRYMDEHPGEWRLAAHYPDCNGLDVWERVE